MNGDHSDKIAAVAWPWREAGKSQSDPAHGAIRRGLKQTVIMAAVAAALFFLGHRILPRVVIGMAGINLILAVAAPRAFAAVERFWLWVAHGAGVAATWALLVPFFYLCFLPARLVLLARGRDPMRRRFPSPEPTCWTLRKNIPDPTRYRKQF